MIYLNLQNINGLNLYCYCINNLIILKDDSGSYYEKVGSSNYFSELKNKDGSWSIYDNDRFDDYGPFHKQIFVIHVDGFKKQKDKFGGKVGFDLITEDGNGSILVFRC